MTNPTDLPTEAVFEAIRQGMRQVHSEVGLAQRDQHPRAIGVVRARFEVADVPAEYALGLFAGRRVFDAWIRFSNGKELHDDRQPDVHGMAIQVLDVPGQRQGGDPLRSLCQDFVLVDHPVFFARDARHFLEFLELKGRQAKELSGAAGNPSELTSLKQRQLREMIGGFPVLTHFFSQPENVLASTYSSQTPFQFGPMAGRWFAKPLPGETPLPVGQDTPHRLSEALQASLSTGCEVRFAFGIQLQSDLQRMPLEDATDPWTGAPQITLATITIPPQEIAGEIPAQFAEAIEFNPWHALVEHLPLGSINQVRRLAYADSQQARRKARQLPETRTGEANRAMLQRFFECFAKRDAMGMRACLHPDVEFQDIGFDLRGDEVGAMWSMITTPKHPDQVQHPIQVQLHSSTVTGSTGEAHWSCQYLLIPDKGGAPLPIENTTTSKFEFVDGLIRRQHDDCDFWKWFRQVKKEFWIGDIMSWIDQLEDWLEKATGLDVPPDIEQKARHGVRQTARRKLDEFLMSNPFARYTRES